MLVARSMLTRGCSRILILVLLLAAPGQVAASPLGVILVQGGRMLAAALMKEGAERGAKAILDHALGTRHVERLRTQEVVVEKQIATASPLERAALQKELRLARSQRQMFEKLMTSVPTKQELQALRRQVAGELEEIKGILEEHDQRIALLEDDVRILRERVEALEARQLGPDPADEARFDEAAATAHREITTGLQVRFQVDPGDAFIRTWRRGEPRGILNGRASEYDSRKKGTNTLYLPYDGEYLVYIIHDELPNYRIKIVADSLQDPAMIKLDLRRLGK